MSKGSKSDAIPAPAGERATSTDEVHVILKWAPTWTEDQLDAAIAFLTGMTDRRAIQRARRREGSKYQDEVIAAMRRLGAPIADPPPAAAPAPPKTSEERRADDAAKMVANLRARGTQEAERAIDHVDAFMAGGNVPQGTLPILLDVKEEERISIVLVVPQGTSVAWRPQVSAIQYVQRPEENKASPAYSPDPARVDTCHASGRHGQNLPMIVRHGQISRYTCCDELFVEPKPQAPQIVRSRGK